MGDFCLRSSGKSCVSGLADASDSRPLSMRCLAHRQLGINWSNIPQTESVKATWLCTPECIADVVAIVKSAERNQLHIHAFGSKWSFSDCAFDSTPTSPTCLIDTSKLSGMQQLPAAVQKGGPLNNEYLWYVQCGTTIHDLYTELDKNSQAIQTMGGASGQTIAGAVSTGTHGGDFRIPPIADSALAIHLVGGAGVQYWIEPTNGITDPNALHAWLASGADPSNVDPNNIIYNDDIFNSCLVSIGLMGVVYAFVLQTREPYKLTEYTSADTWQSVASKIPQILQNNATRFLQLAVCPYQIGGTNPCLVTARGELVTSFAACGKGDVDGAVAHLAVQLGGQIGKGELLDEFSNFFSLGLSGLVQGAPAPLIDLAAISTVAGIQALNQPMEGVLVALINACLHKDSWRSVLTSEYPNIMQAEWPPTNCGGDSYKVMDSSRRMKNGVNTDPASVPEDGWPLLSFEVFFPADPAKSTNASWVAYVNEAADTINSATNTFLPGYIGIRFMGKTRAILGMAQWDPTCSVEIAVLAGVNNLRNLMDTLLAISQKYGALQHWGQLVNSSIDGKAYPDVGRWHNAYSEMNRRSNLSWFQTDLSRRAGLTP